MASKNLMKVLTTPAKVASALDWKRIAGASILTLDIHSDRIGMSIAAHPDPLSSSTSSEETLSQHTLEPIHLQSPRKIPHSVVTKLADVVKNYNVCGFVVSWPLQQDTGRMGASCGRVLYTLEQILEMQHTMGSNDTTQQRNGNNSVFTSSRPICLWDGMHTEQPVPDAWGRDPTYATTSEKTWYIASLERYNQDANVVAAQVWEDFVQSHWPEMHEQKEKFSQDNNNEQNTAASHTDYCEWHQSSSSVEDHDHSYGNQKAYA